MTLATQKQKLERKQKLMFWHCRQAHATGDRLWYTLQEKCICEFTQQECRDIGGQCEACLLYNARRLAVPPTKDTLGTDRDAKFGDVTFHDLHMKVRGADGSQ